MKYADQLKKPQWQKKRLDILNRDGFTCKACGDKETTLHVHHFKYQKGKLPWEYPDTNFITLCESCHEEEELFVKLQHEGFIKISRYSDFSIRRMWHISFTMAFLHKYNKEAFEIVRDTLNGALEVNIDAYNDYCDNYK